jgi:hypothetical protein
MLIGTILIERNWAEPSSQALTNALTSSATLLFPSPSFFLSPFPLNNEYEFKELKCFYGLL